VTQNPRNSCLILPVQSGSMMPYLHPGGRVRIECAGVVRARPGDIIVFRESDILVAHRLLFRLSLGRHCYLYQKGDAAGIGHWVKEKQVIGLVTISTDADGTLLYERSTHDSAARWSILALIIRAVLARARSVLKTLVADRSEKR
jgi:signal peptidase I